MKCKDCPVSGKTEGKTFSNKGLCFCAGHPTTKIDPSGDSDCQYGIEDYEAYWKDLVARSMKKER